MSPAPKPYRCPLTLRPSHSARSCPGTSGWSNQPFVRTGKTVAWRQRGERFDPDRSPGRRWCAARPVKAASIDPDPACPIYPPAELTLAVGARSPTQTGVKAGARRGGVPLGRRTRLAIGRLGELRVGTGSRPTWRRPDVSAECRGLRRRFDRLRLDRQRQRHQRGRGASQPPTIRHDAPLPESFAPGLLCLVFVHVFSLFQRLNRTALL